MPPRGFAWACGPCSERQEKELEAENMELPNNTADESSTPPFRCDIPGCSRSFGQKTELIRHEFEVSHGAEHYPCRFPSCKQAAPNGVRRKNGLRAHLKRAHGVEE